MGLCGALGQPQHNEKRAHPEAGLEGIHRQKIGDSQEKGSGHEGGHGQHLGVPLAAKLPGQQTREADGDATGQKAEDADAGGGDAKQNFGETRLKGNQRGMVYVAPGKMMAADEVVELVAVEAVAQMGAPERSEKMDKEINRAKALASKRAERRDIRSSVCAWTSVNE
jgi:hypothetical protein